MPRVSIIVPIYNKAEYLRRGIRSLLDQTLTDIEVILINDGSTDGSLAIGRSFQALDPRIVLIDQPNGGVSRARNAGLKVATGEFVGFLDPDDWAAPDMYRSLLDLARRTGAEVCLGNFYFERGSRGIPVTLDDLPEILEGSQILEGLILDMIAADPERPYKKEIMGSVFRLLIRKDFLETQALTFQPGLAYMEDLVFTIRLLARTSRAAIDEGIHSHYVVHPGSASKGYIPRLFEGLLEVQALLEKTLQEAGVHDKARQRLDQRMLFNAVRAVINEAHEDNPASRTEAIGEVRRIISWPKLLKILPELNASHLPEFRRRTLQSIRDGSAEALYDYFRANRLALDPKASGEIDRPDPYPVEADQKTR